ncbi:glycine-rich domain-containing protein [Streptomyces sp. NPDC059850]|uniref:glycine-rich domain-containing protein n=1 Tax=Streptomyces sp. NPDC059850 TaxID=3346970 RepID=UPI00365538DD
MRDVTALLDPPQRAEAIRTVLRNNPGMDEDTAGRIVDEAVKFVAAAAGASSPLTPSRVVDEGWHALILHTRTYRQLCERVGTFVHHVPQAPDPERLNPEALTRTQQRIVQAGFPVDDALWLAPTDTSIPVAASCQHGPGGPEGSCTGDPDGDGPSGPN